MEIHHMTIQRQTISHPDGVKVIPIKWRKQRYPRKFKKLLKKLGTYRKPPFTTGFMYCDGDNYYGLNQ